MKIYLSVFLVCLGLICFIPLAHANETERTVGVDAYFAGDYLTALAHLQPLAEQGDSASQYYLGYMHIYGYGMAVNLEQGVDWMRKSAAAGYAFAQTDLGYFFANGVGVQRDFELALSWYEKSAAQSESGAFLIWPEPTVLVWAW